MAIFQTKTKEIDGITFKVTQFTASESFGIKRVLANLVAPLLFSIMGDAEIGKSILDSKIDFKSLSSALQNALNSLPEHEFLALLKRMVKNTQAETVMDGKPVSLILSEDAHFDMCFTGKTLTIYPLLFFILEVNFPDFFSKVKGGIGNNFQTIISNALNKSESKPLAGSEKLES